MHRYAINASQPLFVFVLETIYLNLFLIQIDSLKQKCEFQEFELQRAAKKTKEAMDVAVEESAKAKSAKEVIKSLTARVMFFALNSTLMVSFKPICGAWLPFCKTLTVRKDSSAP